MPNAKITLAVDRAIDVIDSRVHVSKAAGQTGDAVIGVAGMVSFDVAEKAAAPVAR